MKTLTSRLRVGMVGVTAMLMLAGWAPLQAQSVHGTLTGVVTDSTGAVIGGAKVSIINTDTGATYNAISTSIGAYTFEDIALGHYNVTVTDQGFKAAVTKGVLIQIGTTASLNVTLQPGEVTQEVTVTSEGPTLQTQSSDVGGVISEKQITELPLALGGVGAMRAEEAFVFLQPATAGPGIADSNGVFLSKVAGGQNYGNEVLIDGISQERAENGSSYDEEAPSVEAISQFKVITSLPEAEFGRTTGGIEDFVTKSGTNSFHGTAYDIYRDQALDANSWFNNGWNGYYCSGSNNTPACHKKWAVPADHKNDYGVNLGGPVRVPKLYNGRDKTFFFFNWEQLKYTLGGTSTSTVPTAAERGGDFSDRLTTTAIGTNACDGSTIYAGQIFDPQTTKTVNGHECRTAFAFNKIDPSRESTVTKALMAYYPQPTNNAVFSNYTLQATRPITNTSETIRVDQNFGANVKYWASYSSRENALYTGGLPVLPSPVSPVGWWQDFTTHFFRTGLDYTFKPNVLNYFVIGYGRSNSKNYSQAANIGKNWSQMVGLKNAGGPNFPGVSMGDGIRNLGNTGNDDDEVDNALQVNDATVWTHGRHNFKFGGEWRYQQFSHIVNRNEYINFSTNETAGELGIGGGLGVASFFLGQADNGGTNVTVHAPRWLYGYYSLYLQDDYRILPNLTLNLGLRWDVDIPRKEAKNFTSNFSPTAIDPEYNIPGALVFGDKCNGCNARWADTWYKDIGPRLGFAWTPDFLHQKTVVRGGAGIIYGPLVYSDFGGGMATGYTVNPSAPSVNGFDPSFQIDAGMPAFAPPPNEDPGIYNGNHVPGSYITKDAGRPATVYSWNLQVEDQLATDLIATVGYVGNHSTDLSSNLLNPNNMSTSHFGLGDALYEPFVGNSAGIAAPFPQFVQNWGGRPALQQALRPFPQYDYIDQGCCLENVGMSSFDALIASVQRHYHQGLTMQVSYTWAKTLTDADSALPNVGQRVVQDMHVENLHLEKAVSWLDLRHTFVFSGLYELPFGKGKAYMNHGFMSQVLGGWEIGTVERMQSGQPLSFGCAVGIPGFQNCIRFSRVPGSSLKSAVYKSGTKHIKPFVVVPPGGSLDPNTNTMFNTEYSNTARAGSPVAGAPYAFYDVNNNYNRDCTSATLSYCKGGVNQPYTFPTGLPRTTSEIRLPPYFNNDMSIIKKFPFYENYTLSIKAEFLNAFNQHTFGQPDLQPYDFGSFGLPTYTVNGPRNVQLTARFSF